MTANSIRRKTMRTKTIDWDLPFFPEMREVLQKNQKKLKKILKPQLKNEDNGVHYILVLSFINCKKRIGEGEHADH